MGEVWSDGTNGEPKFLVSCYPISLQIAVEYQVQTFVFPSISTGVFCYPFMQASKISLNEVRHLLVIDALSQKASFVSLPQRQFSLEFDQ